jgi:putative hemolysin
MEFLLLLFLILLNGAFAMSEIALIAARKARLQKMVADGEAGAATALKLAESPTDFLSTIQIGITSIGILNGIVGESVFARPLGDWLESLGMTGRWADPLATALVVVIVTYLTIVIGELVPKRLGQIGAEAIARRVARPMLWLATVSRPFVQLLSASTHLVLRIFGVRAASAPTVTQEEINALLEEGSDAGVIEKQEHAMVRNVFRLDDRQIASLMVPRGEVVCLDATLPIEENLARIEQEAHTRYPVVRGGMHDIVGVVNARQLLLHALRGDKPDLTTSLEPAAFMPETLTGMELLENFRTSGAELAFVIDEYGEVLGIVTPQDVMEAITGEFKPQRLEDAWAVQREDGSWLLDGLIPIPELKDRLRLPQAPEEDRQQYHTLSGMLMLLLGRLPHTGDRVDFDGWNFEIVDLDGKRIDKVIASRLPETSGEVTPDDPLTPARDVD